MRISPQFINIQDNNGEGRSEINATSNLPWTMEGAPLLRWRYAIFTGNDETHEGPWLELSTAVRELQLPTLVDQHATAVRNVHVQYRDSLDNASTWGSPIGSFRYYTPDAELETPQCKDYLWEV